MSLLCNQHPQPFPVKSLIACRTNLVIILGMMQVSKKIPFDDPQILLTVRAVYIISNLLIIGIYLYIQRQINKKKGTPTRAHSPLIHPLLQNGLFSERLTR